MMSGRTESAIIEEGNHGESDGFFCPQCGGTNCTVWELPHPLYLHWLLNPGCGIMEIFLGMRIPAKIYLCKTCKTGSKHRQYVRCRQCLRFHDGLIWTEKAALGNWLGPVCPDCGKPIPSLWNLTSLLVLIVTVPIWWPIAMACRPRILRWCQRRSIVARQGQLTKPQR
jgi:hypothetical protein